MKLSAKAGETLVGTDLAICPGGCHLGAVLMSSEFLENKLLPAFEPWVNEDFETYLEAIAAMFPLADVIQGDDDTPTWGKVLNPSTFPKICNPQYLAQFAGVVSHRGRPLKRRLP